MTRRESGTRAAGRVSLVGAGPGDPELITVKGWKRLLRTDVVVARSISSAERSVPVTTSMQRSDLTYASL